jgi:hypothetical protein
VVTLALAVLAGAFLGAVAWAHRRRLAGLGWVAYKVVLFPFRPLLHPLLRPLARRLEKKWAKEAEAERQAYLIFSGKVDTESFPVKLFQTV